MSQNLEQDEWDSTSLRYTMMGQTSALDRLVRRVNSRYGIVRRSHSCTFVAPIMSVSDQDLSVQHLQEMLIVDLDMNHSLLLPQGTRILQHDTELCARQHEDSITQHSVKKLSIITMVDHGIVHSGIRLSTQTRVVQGM